MKITFEWLKDHLKTSFKEKHLLEKLTNIGLEVESVENLSVDDELFKVLFSKYLFGRFDNANKERYKNKKSKINEI